MATAWKSPVANRAQFAPRLLLYHRPLFVWKQTVDRTVVKLRRRGCKSKQVIQQPDTTHHTHADETNATLEPSLDMDMPFQTVLVVAWGMVAEDSAQL